ncbi:unnamed protein product [Strongylus vulgaris]|uniref:Uncharacterized protein n=1 Tax=Strongylus vulgaris TaxID=40348 RepID=A0A3P7L769_STRVU|nr:unnamed protein product [Strongylus vulgaris]
MRKSDIVVSELASNTTLCFRVSYGGIFGYSSATTAQPILIELSSWYDIAGRPDGWSENLECMKKLVDDVARHRQSPVWRTGSILYTDGKVLCTNDDCLPLIQVDNNVTTIANEDFLWLMKMSFCWEELGTLSDSVPDNSNIDTCLR